MKHPSNWFNSLLYALNGLTLATSERNMRFHIAASTAAVSMTYILDASLIEWALICSAIGAVLITECVNTCIEHICDMITTGYSVHVKHIKDIAAAAVLISALYALAIASFILLPKILHLTTYNYVY